MNKLPAIPCVDSRIPPDIHRVLSPMKQILDSAIEAGKSGKASPFGGMSESDVKKLMPDLPDALSDFSVPPTPADLIVSGGFATIMLTWLGTGYRSHGYTEIWRNTVDDIATAVLIGQSPGTQYADAIGNSMTAFYWVRFVSQAGVTGPYNAVSGTKGQTSLDPNYVLSVLGIPESNPFYIQATPTTINGVAVPAGAYIRAAFIANGSISSTKIGLAAIDTARIADGAIVNAKIEDAAITSTKIKDASITSAKIAKLAVGTAHIADATITAAKICDAEITAAKIKDATITGAKIKDATITSAKIESLDANKIKAQSLAAITTNVGTLTIDKEGCVRSGQESFNTGNGFWLGMDDGVTKFSVGGNGKGFYWDGANFALYGELIGVNNILGRFTQFYTKNRSGAIPHPYLIDGATLLSVDDVNFSGGVSGALLVMVNIPRLDSDLNHTGMEIGVYVNGTRVSVFKTRNGLDAVKVDGEYQTWCGLRDASRIIAVPGLFTGQVTVELKYYLWGSRVYYCDADMSVIGFAK